MYRLSDHSLAIETGRHKKTWLPKEEAVCPLQPGTGGNRGPLPTFLPQVPLNSKPIFSEIHSAKHYI